ncbi:MAG: hypothetical protein H8E30_07415 [Alphaproteobacteria bacterium]|nr:hypothetical protein [Alphaproteobacteria bacterium]
MPHNQREKLASLQVVEGHMNNQSLPPSVQENFAQHYENLTRLAGSLRELGMEQEAIDEHVIGIFGEYERELATNIERIKAGQQ